MPHFRSHRTYESALLPSIDASFLDELLLGLTAIGGVQLRVQLGSAVPKIELHHIGVPALDMSGQVLREQVWASHRPVDLDQGHYFLGDLL